MNERILIENGLTEKEAEIYLAVLAGGEMSFSQLAAKTSIKRTTIYHVVEALKLKGIASVSKRRGAQYISALSPRILVDRFKTASNEAEKILPSLLDLAYASPFKPRLQFFEGLSGIKEILMEFSYSKVSPLGFTDYEKMPKELFRFIRQEIVPLRRKHSTKAKFIVPDNPTNRQVLKSDQTYASEHRIAEFPIPEYGIELLLFGESKVAFLSFVREEMFGMILDSKAVHHTLQNIFQLVWNGAHE